MDVQVGTTGIFVGKCSKDGGKLELWNIYFIENKFKT